MSEIRSVEELRQQGLEKMRANQIEQALPLFDQALALAQDDETRELITINKASVHVRLGEATAEVQQLPRIIMRRRNPRHVWLASYYLAAKFENEKEFSKARFYLEIALTTAQETDDTEERAQTLVHLGNNYVFDSRPDEAISCYTEALALLGEGIAGGIWRAFALQNLGYARLLKEDSAAGVELILEAVSLMKVTGAEGYASESYIDLCHGYLDLGDLEKAQHYGELGLEGATEQRQVRNAHYLLGEVAHNLGESERAAFHFEKLAAYYPEFPHLKNLLVAIDLRKMVNFKL